MEKKLWLIIILSLIGLGVAIYQTYEHYWIETSLCDWGSNFSCSAVTESRFGEFPANSGVATAFWGVIWWIGGIFLTVKFLRNPEWIKNLEFIIFTYLLSGMLFVVYLLIVELYILPMETGELIICPFCTVQHIIMVILLAVSFTLLHKPLKQYFNEIVFKDGKLNPVVGYFGVVGVLLLGGMFVILAPDPQIQHYEFSECLVQEGATMYGFDACPACNKQKNVIGQEAFTDVIEAEGYYVKCRPEEEGQKQLGDRVNQISSIEDLSPETTQIEACGINVVKTPTWVIYGEQHVGVYSLEEMSEITGCPVPGDT